MKASVKLLSSLVFASGLAASCGGKDSKETTTVQAPQNTAVSAEAAKAEGQKLPQIAIVRVPVDADGKEVNDAAEMRLVATNQSLSESNIATSFDKASDPQATTDELDQTSSSESYRGWVNWGVRYRARYTGWNWNNYRPTYYNRGYTYNYRYTSHYRVSQNSCGVSCGCVYASCQSSYGYYNSYNYYQYGQGFNQVGYSNYGYNPAMGYGYGY
jgi:hypothetical protein